MGKPRLTNEEFGRRIGVTHSMASRLRSGERLPSVQVLRKIHHELGIPLAALVEAHHQGEEEFGKLLRDKLGEDDPAVAQPA